MLSGLKRLILWDYPRGSWQYDVMVAAIVAFVFLPEVCGVFGAKRQTRDAIRQWFRDQPRIPHAAQITSLPSHGESVFWIESEMVAAIPETNRLAELGKLLTARTGRKQELTRVEPIFDSEQEIKGYMAFAKP